MSDYFDRIERQIVERVEAGAPRSARRPTIGSYLATVAAAAVVIVVVGVFLLAHGSSPAPTRPSAPAAGKTVTVTFKASAIAPHAPLGPAIERSITILSERLDSSPLGLDATVERSGNGIVVVARNAGAGTRARILSLTTPGWLEIYDWEANAITPNGKTVASQLKGQNAEAVRISQGSGTAAPGDPWAGGVSRRQTAALAAERPGSTVVEAIAPSVALGASAVPGNARFFVLANLLPALSNRDITHPKAVRDPNAGVPEISFGFTRTGAVAFRTLTKRVSERGAHVSGLGDTLNQHFAIALDGRLITVPYVDFKQFPDGVDPANGASISGGFTTQSAQELATILRYGPLPVNLTVTG